MCTSCREATRAAIDRIDDDLARLLVQRCWLSGEVVARRLAEGGLPRDDAREEEVLARASRLARSPGERDALEEVYRALFERAAVTGREAEASPCPGPRPVQVGRVTFGGGQLTLIAGPCAVEDEAQLAAAAAAARAAGATVLRGGAFKPRTSPRAFQGLGERALPMLRRAADANGLLLVTEVLEPGQVERTAEVADILQVGSRSMHVTPLLRAVGRAGRPVLLKRGMAATIEEVLGAVAYVRDAGCEDIILCLRGVRTVCDASRFTLDLAAVPVLRERTGLPVIVDPSHAAGRRDLVPPLALAAVAGGADGLMIEVHPDPARALSDGPQALTPAALFALMTQARAVEEVLRGALEPSEAGRCASQAGAG